MKALAAGITVAVLSVSSCATHHRAADPAHTSGPPPATVFVTGDGITAGDGLTDALHQAWPRLVFRQAFPLGSVLVNGAGQGATVGNAITAQLPIAAGVHPDTALVWLGVEEATQGESPGTFEQSLRTLFAGLHADGAKRIVVAGLPSGVAEANAGAFNTAISRAAAGSGARFVDLSNVHARVDALGNVAPTAELHRAIADDFIRVLAQP